MLDNTDKKFLVSLYKLRCLTLKQAYLFFYKKKCNDSKEFYNTRVKPLVEEQYCQFAKVDGEFIFKVTQKTIDFVNKEYALPSEVFDINQNKTIKTSVSLRDIKIQDKQVRHQVSLNDFVLEFQKRYAETYGSKVPINYYDEKYLSTLSNIRPDGLYRIGPIDLFLEQDMGTETSKQLADKWSRYRRYLNYEFDGQRRIVVLFIINCNSPDLRRALVQRTVINSFDTLLNNKFDIFIGTKDQLLESCFNRIISGTKKTTLEYKKIMERHNFQIDDGSKLKVKLGGSVYHYYLTSHTPDKRLAYYRPNKNRPGRFQEFLSDSYIGAPVSILSKIAYHDKNSHNFDIAYSPKANYRLIGYIVLVDNIYQIYNDLKVTELLSTRNVFFTTKDRLVAYSLPKALFAFDNEGNIITCTNAYFEPTELEGNINDYEANGIKKRK